MRIQPSNIKSFIEKTREFGLYIPITGVLMTYASHILSEKALTAISDNRNKRIQQHLEPIVERCIGNTSLNANCEHCSEIIWFCWLQGEENLPIIQHLCLSSIRANSNGHQVIVLNNKNYSQYVHLPKIVIDTHQSGRMKPAHFADILRVNLLAQQGGLWLDATMLLTKPIPEEWFKSTFYTIKTQPEGHYVSQCRWAVFCLAGMKGSPIYSLLANAFEQYLSSGKVFVDYFMFDHFIDILYRSVPEIKHQIDQVPYNNPDVHSLGTMLFEEDNVENYDKLCQHTYLYKLSTLDNRRLQIQHSSKNLFSHLIEQYDKEQQFNQ